MILKVEGPREDLQEAVHGQEGRGRARRVVRGARRARSSASSARTAPARRRRSRCSPASSRRRAATATLFGMTAPSPEAMGRVGFLPENPYVYPYLTPREFVTLCGRSERHARRGAARSRRARCSRRRASPTPPIAPCARCRRGCSSASASPRRSCTTRRC